MSAHVSTTPAAAKQNLLIISDLHLGEDIKPATRMGQLRHLVLLERQLEAFLSHYSKTRHDGRPWRLVVNGDMVDFLAVCLLPREGDLEPEARAEAEGHPEDLVYGLGNRPAAAKNKMARVLARHPGVFRTLAEFIGAGNELSIIVGNHDVEFHWPVVQETFKRGVSARWNESRPARRPGAMTAAEVEQRITFHPWFYFQENVVWVEHGHQYDEYCSFDYLLNPVTPDGEEVILNVGAAGARYISNHLEGCDPHQQEDWDAIGHIRWTLAQGARGMARVYRSYVAFVLRMLGMWRMFAKQPAEVEARRRTHREKLRELAARTRLDEKTLEALDDLRHRPLMHNLGKLIAALMLDRMLVLATTVLLILVFVLALPWGWALAAVGGTIALGWLTNWWLSRGRMVDPAPKMRAVTQRIRNLVHTPYVVMGHSHYPQAVKLDGGGMYFNTGTWVATERPGLLQSFTHVLIRHDKGGPRAELCQWRDGKSIAFTPSA
jgi:UDP-2,3-diacylglucosamine pyrophosphatase LpxH